MLSAVVIVPVVFWVVRAAGGSDAAAAVWGPAAGAVLAAFLLWRAARSGDPAPPAPPRPGLGRRVLGLLVLTWLAGSLISGFVARLVPVDASPHEAVAINLRLSNTLSLPATLLVVYAVGRLSARWLTVRSPLRWLVAISLVPVVAATALHPLALVFADRMGGIPPREISDIAARWVQVTVLVYCALAYGNLRARRPGAVQPAVANPERSAPASG